MYGSAFRTAAIGILVRDAAAAFQKKYRRIMAGTYFGELVEDGDQRSLIVTFKAIGKKRIYCTPSNLKLELMGRQIILDLMDLFWEGAQKLSAGGEIETKTFPGRIGALLSQNYRRVFVHSMQTMNDLPENYHRLHLVTDYICGMTDSFAKRLHAELGNG